MLVGSWPFELLESPAAEGLEAYRTRIHAALEKALREGKRRSNWAAPNAEYETAMQAFAQEALRPEGGFLTGFLPFVRRVARLGVQNSLVQTTLKLMAPGVPDTYQGCELWDLSLVDPDNRRPVDYREREAALAALRPRLEADTERAGLFESLLTNWPDGRIKLALTAVLLGLRRDRPELFAEGDYAPIELSGEDGDWAVGFVRASGPERVAVLAARFPAQREAKPDWQARAQMPEGEWFDVMRGRRFDARSLSAAWLGALPVAVLTSTAAAME
jgi:(1->4)-alpha-D-glucan 1-alpha-D-glucosylmutase